MRAKSRARVRQDEERPEPLIPSGAAALLDRRAVCRLLGVGASKFHSMIAVGDYPGPDIKIGKLSRWTVEAHNAAVAALRSRGGTHGRG